MNTIYKKYSCNVADELVSSMGIEDAIKYCDKPMDYCRTKAELDYWQSVRTCIITYRDKGYFADMSKNIYHLKSKV